MRLRVSLALLVILVACGGRARNIPGTKIPANDENRAILDTVEQYRKAVEQKDAAALLILASPEYHEDSGTTQGTDDYGYEELRQVLAGRFQQAEDIRYSLRYMQIRRSGDLAFVDVIISASFTIKGASGELVRKDKRDQNQLVLVWDHSAERWKFLSGM